MKELLPGIFAIEVPEDAKDCTIKNGTYVKWLLIDGNPFTPINDPAKFRILFTTKDCSEEQAGSVVERQRGGGKYNDYSVAGSLAKTGTYLLVSAVNSLQSLLRSHNLTGKNYLLIKKQQQ